MTFDKPVIWEEGLQLRAVKSNLPNTLSSVELRSLGPEILQRANFSARVFSAGFLDEIAGVEMDLQAGEITVAQARQRLEIAADAMSERELLTDQRIKLIVETNDDLSAGYALKLAGNNDVALDEFPCWEFIRVEERKVHRDWESRWQQACADSGDDDALRVFQESGVMCARIDSDLWDSLGSMFDDSLDVDYPPFAFNSGMGVRLMSRARAEELGIIDEGETVQPVEMPDFNASLKAGADFRDQRLAEDVLQKLGPQYEIAGGVLQLKAAA